MFEFGNLLDGADHGPVAVAGEAEIQLYCSGDNSGFLGPESTALHHRGRAEPETLHSNRNIGHFVCGRMRAALSPPPNRHE